MNRIVKWPIIAVGALLLLSCFDHMMRIDQTNMCHNGDAVECPESLWWFA